MATATSSSLSPSQIASIVGQAQQAQLTAAEWSKLSAADQSQVKQAISALNANYLKMTIPKYALCEANGGSLSASYSSANPTVMTFQIPQSASGWATELVIDASLTVAYTAKTTSPTIAVNAAGVAAAFSSLTLQFGSNTSQIDLRPYFAYVNKRLSGYNRSLYGQTAGNAVSGISALLYTSPTVNAGNNTWIFRIRVPLNALHPLTAEGMLPAMGNTGKGIIRLQPSSEFNGVDPILSAVTTNGTISVTGTVKMKMGYRDGHSLATLQQLAPVVLGPAGIGTVQYVQLEAKQNLVANLYQRQHISTTLPMYRLINLVIDGNQSSSFSTVSNIIGYEVSLDANAGTALYKYDNSENVTMTDYYEVVRDQYGQDMDEGVMIACDALGQNVVNPSNQDGQAFFNMTSNGYTAAHVGVKLGSVGSVSGIAPRIENWALVVNPLGLSVK